MAEKKAKAVIKKSTKVQFLATGRRKKAIARVFLIPNGSGKITINKQDINEYFPLETLKLILRQPLALTNTTEKFDINVNVIGGGLSGQAGAVRHGISRCLDLFEPELHKVLRQGGFLTRDSRAVERKKAGRSKARKRYQFSKR